MAYVQKSSAGRQCNVKISFVVHLVTKSTFNLFEISWEVTHLRPTFSIITACFNAARTIEQTIKSVIEQDYPDIEYIIVDGASTDGTMDIFDRYRDRIARVISEPDKGIYDAFNKGVRAASGEIIGIVNADDFYSPHCLAHVARACKETPDADVCYGKIVVVDESLREWKIYPIGDPNGLYADMSISHPAVFVRKSAYERYGVFDDTFKIAGDWDLMLRMFTSGAKFAQIDHVLTAFRFGGTSSHASRAFYAERSRIYRRYLSRSAATKAIMKMYVKDLKIYTKLFIRTLMVATGTYKYYASYRDSRKTPLSKHGELTNETDIWAEVGENRDII